MSIASTETYSSPCDLEKSTAFCSASLDSRLRKTSPPLTLGRVAMVCSTPIFTPLRFAPIFWKMKFTMVSPSEIMAFSRCTGSICCWPACFA